MVIAAIVCATLLAACVTAAGDTCCMPNRFEASLALSHFQYWPFGGNDVMLQGVARYAFDLEKRRTMTDYSNMDLPTAPNLAKTIIDFSDESPRQYDIMKDGSCVSWTSYDCCGAHCVPDDHPLIDSFTLGNEFPVSAYGFKNDLYYRSVYQVKTSDCVFLSTKRQVVFHATGRFEEDYVEYRDVSEGIENDSVLDIPEACDDMGRIKEDPLPPYRRKIAH